MTNTYSDRQLDFVKRGCRSSFKFYVKTMVPGYEMNWHHRLLANRLQAAVERGSSRLMVFMPPRHGKSEQTSRRLPAWFLGKYPDREIIFTTYSQDFADDFGQEVKGQLEDELFQYVFPECQLSHDARGKRKFTTTAGGKYVAVGAQGPLTGRGGDLIIIDDPHKNRQEANSDVIREGIHNWFKSTLYTRVSPTGTIIIIQTRWHEDDLSGRIISEQGEKWELIDFPAIAEKDEHIRKVGQPLWAPRWDVHKLAEVKETIGSYEWAALYQQRPSPEEGGIFKRSWFKYYKELPPDNELLIKTWSWDTAIKEGQENDYSVGLCGFHYQNGFYVVDLWRNRAEFPELQHTIKMQFNKTRTNEVLVEDKASGQQVVQAFKRIETMPVIPMMPGKSMPLDKVTRAQLVAPLVEAGKVFLPENEPWVADFIEELCVFPNGRWDDQTDAFTQWLARALNRQRQNSNVGAPVTTGGDIAAVARAQHAPPKGI